VTWYRQNEWWWRPIKQEDPAFGSYYQAQYGETRG
jgi:dTDP-D-glucose 4,6-dehydratase